MLKSANVFISAIIVSFFSCTDKREYSINGEIDGLDSGKVFLSLFVNADSFRVDSTVIKDGRFLFKGSLPEATLGSIYVGGKSNDFGNLDFLVGFDEVDVNILATDTSLTLRPIADKGLNSNWFKLLDQVDPIQNKISDYYILADQEGLSDNQIDSLYLLAQDGAQQLDSVISHFPTSIAQLFMAIQQGLSVDKVQFYEGLLRSASPTISKSVPAQTLELFLDRAKRTALKQPAPDFTLPDSTGKPISLSSLKDKYVLIDFWASWCGPCRAESPNLVAAFNQYRDRDFTILSISIDRKADEWRQAASKDGYEWFNVIDADGKIASNFNVMAIPANWLLNKDGVIIAKDLRGDELIAALKKEMY